jgi:RNA polymerase subunit RPABC4/transcription elongation factor Spt4
MKYCFQCNRVTTGEPIFCNFCGSSYDTKLCPRLHPNPRRAEVCSQCGSRDLSTPQPKVPLWGKALIKIVPWLVAIPLVIATVLAGIDVLCHLLARPKFQAGMAALVLLMVALWCLWSMLPEWIRKAIYHALSKDDRREHGKKF